MNSESTNNVKNNCSRKECIGCSNVIEADYKANKRNANESDFDTNFIARDITTIRNVEQMNDTPNKNSNGCLENTSCNESAAKKEHHYYNKNAELEHEQEEKSNCECLLDNWEEEEQEENQGKKEQQPHNIIAATEQKRNKGDLHVDDSCPVNSNENKRHTNIATSAPIQNTEFVNRTNNVYWESLSALVLPASSEEDDNKIILPLSSMSLSELTPSEKGDNSTQPEGKLTPNNKNNYTNSNSISVDLQQMHHSNATHHINKADETPVPNNKLEVTVTASKNNDKAINNSNNNNNNKNEISRAQEMNKNSFDNVVSNKKEDKEVCLLPHSASLHPLRKVNMHQVVNVAQAHALQTAEHLFSPINMSVSGFATMQNDNSNNNNNNNRVYKVAAFDNSNNNNNNNNSNMRHEDINNRNTRWTETNTNNDESKNVIRREIPNEEIRKEGTNITLEARAEVATVEEGQPDKLSVLVRDDVHEHRTSTATSVLSFATSSSENSSIRQLSEEPAQSQLKEQSEEERQRLHYNNLHQRRYATRRLKNAPLTIDLPLALPLSQSCWETPLTRSAVSANFYNYNRNICNSTNSSNNRIVDGNACSANNNHYNCNNNSTIDTNNMMRARSAQCEPSQDHFLLYNSNTHHSSLRGYRLRSIVEIFPHLNPLFILPRKRVFVYRSSDKKLGKGAYGVVMCGELYPPSPSSHKELYQSELYHPPHHPLHPYHEDFVSNTNTNDIDASDNLLTNQFECHRDNANNNNMNNVKEINAESAAEKEIDKSSNNKLSRYENNDKVKKYSTITETVTENIEETSNHEERSHSKCTRNSVINSESQTECKSQEEKVLLQALPSEPSLQLQYSRLCSTSLHTSEQNYPIANYCHYSHHHHHRSLSNNVTHCPVHVSTHSSSSFVSSEQSTPLHLMPYNDLTASFYSRQSHSCGTSRAETPIRQRAMRSTSEENWHFPSKQSKTCNNNNSNNNTNNTNIICSNVNNDCNSNCDSSSSTARVIGNGSKRETVNTNKMRYMVRNASTRSLPSVVHQSNSRNVANITLTHKMSGVVDNELYSKEKNSSNITSNANVDNVKDNNCSEIKIINNNINDNNFVNNNANNGAIATSLITNSSNNSLDAITKRTCQSTPLTIPLAEIGADELHITLNTQEHTRVSSSVSRSTTCSSVNKDTISEHNGNSFTNGYLSNKQVNHHHCYRYRNRNYNNQSKNAHAKDTDKNDKHKEHKNHVAPSVCSNDTLCKLKTDKTINKETNLDNKEIEEEENDVDNNNNDDNNYDDDEDEDEDNMSPVSALSPEFSPLYDVSESHSSPSPLLSRIATLLTSSSTTTITTNNNNNHNNNNNIGNNNTVVSYSNGSINNSLNNSEEEHKSNMEEDYNNNGYEVKSNEQNAKSDSPDVANFLTQVDITSGNIHAKQSCTLISAVNSYASCNSNSNSNNNDSDEARNSQNNSKEKLSAHDESGVINKIAVTATQKRDEQQYMQGQNASVHACEISNDNENNDSHNNNRTVSDNANVNNIAKGANVECDNKTKGKANKEKSSIHKPVAHVAELEEEQQQEEELREQQQQRQRQLGVNDVATDNNVINNNNKSGSSKSNSTKSNKVKNKEQQGLNERSVSPSTAITPPPPPPHLRFPSSTVSEVFTNRDRNNYYDYKETGDDYAIPFHAVAVKIVCKTDLTRLEFDEAVHNEVHMASHLNHPCLVNYFGITEDVEDLLLIMDLSENGNLKEYQAKFGVADTREMAPRFVADIVLALEYFRDEAQHPYEPRFIPNTNTGILTSTSSSPFTSLFPTTAHSLSAHRNTNAFHSARNNTLYHNERSHFPPANMLPLSKSLFDVPSLCRETSAKRRQRSMEHLQNKESSNNNSNSNNTNTCYYNNTSNCCENITPKERHHYNSMRNAEHERKHSMPRVQSSLNFVDNMKCDVTLEEKQGQEHCLESYKAQEKEKCNTQKYVNCTKCNDSVNAADVELHSSITLVSANDREEQVSKERNEVKNKSHKEYQEKEQASRSSHIFSDEMQHRSIVLHRDLKPENMTLT